MNNNDIFYFEENQSFFVSFTDIVTLLLIFFIYLTTISNFNSSELDIVSEQISSKFQVELLSKNNISNLNSENVADPWSTMSKTLHQNLLPNESIRLSLDQSLLFRPGSASLLESGKPYLKQLADVLKSHPYQIIIEGHSDSTPINNDKFQSNWHLSAMRAAEVTDVLESFGIPGNQLSCRGFGETRPIEKNATSSLDHLKNRRVQIYIKPLKGDSYE